MTFTLTPSASQEASQEARAEPNPRPGLRAQARAEAGAGAAWRAAGLGVPRCGHCPRLHPGSLHLQAQLWCAPGYAGGEGGYDGGQRDWNCGLGSLTCCCLGSARGHQTHRSAQLPGESREGAQGGQSGTFSTTAGLQLTHAHPRTRDSFPPAEPGRGTVTGPHAGGCSGAGRWRSRSALWPEPSSPRVPTRHAAPGSSWSSRKIPIPLGLPGANSRSKHPHPYPNSTSPSNKAWRIRG